MTPSSPDPHDELRALGKVLAEARLARNLDRSVMARQLTLSLLQIQQIEDGGDTAFYTLNHKLLAARKVAAFLQVVWPPAGDDASAPVGMDDA